MIENFPSANLEKELDENGAYLLISSGDSMKPLLDGKKDTVIVSKKAGRLKKYDVALYRIADGRHVLHRVIAVKDGYYITRGDNTYTNEKINEDDVIGVLTSFRRKGKSCTTDKFSYKLYSVFWHFIYPLRYLFLKIRTFFSRAFRKIFKKGRK